MVFFKVGDIDSGLNSSDLTLKRKGRKRAWLSILKALVDKIELLRKLLGVKDGLVCAESFAHSFIQEEKEGLAFQNRFQSERISRASSKDRHGTESNK